MSRPVLSSAVRRLSQHTTAHCTGPFSISRFLFSASSENSASRIPSIYNSLHASTTTRPDRYALRRVNASANASAFSAPRHRAAFSSSSVRPAAKVVQNARNDEEGKPLLVDISARAAEVRCSISFFLCFLCAVVWMGLTWLWMGLTWLLVGS